MNTETKRRIRKLCDSFDNVAMIIDKDTTECVYCNKPKFIEIGEIPTFLFDAAHPNDFSSVSSVIIDSRHYAARCVEVVESLYLIEIFSEQDLIKMLGRTDAMLEIKPYITSLENSAANMRMLAYSLNPNLCNFPNSKEKIENFQNTANSVNMMTLNFLHLIETKTDPDNMEVIDFKAFIRDMGAKCKKYLTQCSKNVTFEYNSNFSFIRGSFTNACYMLANIVFYALLYNPQEDDVIFVIDSKKDNFEEYFIFQTSMDKKFFYEKKLPDGSIMELDFSLFSMGTEIIKSFADECGGKFYLTESGEKIAMGIKFPIYEPPYTGTLKFYDKAYSSYVCGRADIIEIMMTEISNIYGNNKSRS